MKDDMRPPDPAALRQSASDQGERIDDRGSPIDAPERVGYRQPPRHTRFKPGESGNKRGRPKGSKSVDAVLQSLLNQKVTIQDAAGRRRVPAVEALLRALMQRALRGDNRAAKLLLDGQQRLPPPEAPANEAASAAEDQEILEEYLARRRAFERDADAG